VDDVAGAVTGTDDLGHGRHAQRGAVGVEHAGEVVLLEDGQAQRLLVKGPRPAQVGGGHESHQIPRLQHSVSFWSDARLIVSPLRGVSPG
jgi:hypothetical protein